MNVQKFSFSILILIFFLLTSCSGKEKDPYPEFAIPAYSNSYDVETGFDESVYGKTVSYFVREKFPASDVQNFYESFLTKKGFSKLENYPYADKTWVTFNLESGKWDIVADSQPARYFSAWVDSHKNLLFKLTLNYKDSDELSVTCFLHPYIPHNLFAEFDKWVTKMGKEKEFYELLSKYTKPNHRIDIKRAIKENPDNELIMKFARAAEQDRKDIATAYKAYKKSIKKD